jgi:hypothetical protein
LACAGVEFVCAKGVMMKTFLALPIAGMILVTVMAATL